MVPSDQQAVSLTCRAKNLVCSVEERSKIVSTFVQASGCACSSFRIASAELRYVDKEVVSTKLERSSFVLEDHRNVHRSVQSVELDRIGLTKACDVTAQENVAHSTADLMSAKLQTALQA